MHSLSCTEGVGGGGGGKEEEKLKQVRGRAGKGTRRRNAELPSHENLNFSPSNARVVFKELMSPFIEGNSL